MIFLKHLRIDFPFFHYHSEVYHPHGKVERETSYEFLVHCSSGVFSQRQFFAQV